MPVKISIITCGQWGARAPLEDPVLVNKSDRFVCHHTVSHVRQIGDPAITTMEEAKRYARDIQNFHMDTNGWNDSGHNFLVCRAGWILQGRWVTVSAIQHKKMVQSAHCPGQNDQIGIEFEHLGTEKMTAKQRAAGARLMAWASSQYGRTTCLPMDPHGKYIATACPANLITEIPTMRTMANDILRQEL